MADKNIIVKHIQRNDTRDNWLSTNPILSKGELGVESDTFKIKIGNGVDRYATLPYFGGGTISKIETKKVVATQDAQTAFEIPFEDYEQNKCFLDVRINSVWINPDKYTINGKILTLKSGRKVGTEVFFTCHYLENQPSDSATVVKHKHTVSDITDFPTSLPANGGNADTVDGKHATDFRPSTWKPTPSEIGAMSVSGVNNNAKLGQYIKFYDYDDNGSDGTAKQAYLRDGKWVTNFTDMTVNNMNIVSEINNLKTLANSAGKMYMPQGSAKIKFPNPPKRKGNVYLGKMVCKYGGYIAIRATFLNKVSHVDGYIEVNTITSTITDHSSSSHDFTSLSEFNISDGATLPNGNGYKTVLYTSAVNVSTTETNVIRVEPGQILQFGAFGIDTGESVITDIQVIYEEVAL